MKLCLGLDCALVQYFLLVQYLVGGRRGLRTRAFDDMDFENIIEGWTAGKMQDGRSIDDIMQIDGMPLWWAFHRLIVKDWLPGLPPFSAIRDAFLSNAPPKISRVRMAILRQALYAHERIKWRKKRRYLPTPRKKIIFLTHSNHILSENGKLKFYRTDSVIKRLVGEGHIEPMVLVVHPLSRRGSSAGYPTLYDFIEKEAMKKASRIAQALAKEWKKLSDWERERLLLVNGKSAYPYIRHHLEFLFSRRFIQVFLTYYFALKDHVAGNNVRGVYLTASIGVFEKCCLMVGALLSIPVYVAQHGSGTGFAKIPAGLRKRVTFLVFGQRYKELVVSDGTPAENVVITGSPMADEIAALVPRKSKQMKRILLLTQPFVEDKLWKEHQRVQFFDAVHELMKELGQMWVIKTHPRENKEVYYKAFPNVAVSDMKLYDEIVKADLVVGVNSTSLQEALLLNRPVVALDIFGQAKEESHVAAGLSLRLSGWKDAKYGVEEYLRFYRGNEFDRKREKFIRDYFYKLDGKATERIVKVIRK